ncbi:MFS transporter [bacterium]|nr:MFS transporter [bacterium]
MEPRPPLSPFVSLIITVVIPSLVLAKGGQYSSLTPHQLLFIALAFPLTAGIYEFIRFKKADFISVFGFVSTLATGGLSLMELTNFWFAVKEATIPGLIGVFVIATAGGTKPLVYQMIYNEKVIDVPRVHTILVERQAEDQFKRLMKSTTMILAGSFFLSSFLNFTLARILLQSPSGTPAFNEELGRMTALSYPVIALPSMAVMIFALLRLVRELRKLTGLSFEEILKTEQGTVHKK